MCIRDSFVFMATIAFGYYWLNYQDPEILKNINNLMLIYIIFGIIGFIIGLIIFTVYEVAIDAILQCFLVDEELASRLKTTPKNVPDAIADFFESNQQHSAARQSEYKSCVTNMLEFSVEVGKIYKHV
eukprot:TRINITY_DN1230_c0_g1_i2.p1 TRINITY_DN1230_c0_g1~~TRINITY_DN1230_c0_g1_i2.p1  ORF type:complete len:128 (-),score=35.89 TRINITY_DN1230_c0_g1_i2:137-520(-)